MQLKTKVNKCIKMQLKTKRKEQEKKMQLESNKYRYNYMYKKDPIEDKKITRQEQEKDAIRKQKV